MTFVLWFLAMLISLLVLVRWAHRHLLELTFLLIGHKESTIYIYAVLLFPGVVLHELSHYVAAQFLGVRVYELSLRPTIRRDRSVRLGFVRMRKPDFVRGLLIGLAPLLVGSLAVVLIGQHVFDTGTALQATQTDGLGALVHLVGDAFRVPDAWIWFYLIFVISNAMLPSPADREGLGAVMVFAGAALALTLLVDWGPELLVNLVQPMDSVIKLLTAALGFTLFVDALVVGLLIVLKTLAGWLLGRRLA